MHVGVRVCTVYNGVWLYMLRAEWVGGVGNDRGEGWGEE